jgi:hypothetical protein
MNTVYILVFAKRTTGVCLTRRTTVRCCSTVLCGSKSILSELSYLYRHFDIRNPPICISRNRKIIEFLSREYSKLHQCHCSRHAVVQFVDAHCATSRKFACLITAGIFGIFLSPNPSGRTIALGSTHSLTEMSTSDLPGKEGVKMAGAQGWQSYHLYVLIVKNPGNL